MAGVLVVSLIVNALLVIFASAIFVDRHYYKSEAERLAGKCDRLQDTVNIQAKRLIDIRTLSKT